MWVGLHRLIVEVYLSTTFAALWIALELVTTQVDFFPENQFTRESRVS